VRELLRPEQVFARVGGDEFVILTPETGLDGATTLAEKIRLLVANLKPEEMDEQIGITCSVGVAELVPGMETPDDLFRAADKALYSSKRQGGDRVTSQVVS